MAKHSLHNDLYRVMLKICGDWIKFGPAEKKLYGDPHFFFFLKGKMIVYEINTKIFIVRIFNIQFTLKIQILF